MFAEFAIILKEHGVSYELSEEEVEALRERLTPAPEQVRDNLDKELTYSDHIFENMLAHIREHGYSYVKLEAWMY